MERFGCNGVVVVVGGGECGSNDKYLTYSRPTKGELVLEVGGGGRKAGRTSRDGGRTFVDPNPVANLPGWA